MRHTIRYEHKYWLNQSQYYAFRAALMVYARRDEFTRVAPNHRYLVRSLYYDTYDYGAYKDTQEGNLNRVKLRFRAYVDCPKVDTKISVELKTKRGFLMEKYSSFVALDELESFNKTKHWSYEDKVLSDAERLIHKLSLSPKIIVQYLREGYVPKDNSDVRITMDHDVESARAESLFENVILKPHSKRRIILEIKCLRDIPAWLRALVKSYDLKLLSNSKYGQGIELLSPIMITAKENI